MPLGIQRLNAKKTQPNDRIVFIKPLKGKDEAIAQDFLERIAAQCRTSPKHPHRHCKYHGGMLTNVAVPIMKEHHLSVTTLEEYEPNREFVGRNFNAGEIIQLVLKARSGLWLPFNYVQMVMMHELAHCVQMNHSRAFWKVRNLYADQMRVLWSRGYSGEGMWGRGASLRTGEFETNAVTEGEELPEHLCGGTYRSRRRRKRGRKGGDDLSYQERKQRRIEKKFGKNGVALGADDDVKSKLEKGKRTQAKPRVAGSNRGRELRAAAALARFEQQKEEVKSESANRDENEDEFDSDTDYEDAEDADPTATDAVDIDGKRLLDNKGHGMVRVCGDENQDDQDAANELKELQSSMRSFFSPARNEVKSDPEARPVQPGTATRPLERGRNATRNASRAAANKAVTNRKNRDVSHVQKNEAQPRASDTPNVLKDAASDREPAPASKAGDTKPAGGAKACAICSFTNTTYAVTCSMCSHVLEPASVPGTWSCQSTSCKGSEYLNAGDYGTCGSCGEKKSPT